MKDEILVTRRATYKAEEAVSDLEKGKGRQDLFIDRLMDQVTSCRETHWGSEKSRERRGEGGGGGGSMEDFLSE